MEAIQLIGTQQLARLFANSATPKVVNALRMAVTEEAQIAMRDSKRIVPVKDGPLKESGTVLPPTVSGTRVTVELGYGGAASAYAMRQHEDLSYKHKSGKQAKYLENPVRARIPNFEKSLANRLKRILGT
jgi:hypothetical protein